MTRSQNKFAAGAAWVVAVSVAIPVFHRITCLPVDQLPSMVGAVFILSVSCALVVAALGAYAFSSERAGMGNWRDAWTAARQGGWVREFLGTTIRTFLKVCAEALRLSANRVAAASMISLEVAVIVAMFVHFGALSASAALALLGAWLLSVAGGIFAGNRGRPSPSA